MTRAPAAVLAAVLLAVALLPAPVPAQTTEADVYVAQAIVDFDDKRYEDALANLRRALQIQPDHLEALYYSGLVHLALGRPAEAVTFLERARQRAPDDPVVAYQLGLAHFTQQDYARAQPLLEEAFRRDPTRESLGYYVGFMRYRNKDYRGALAAFRGGRSADPQVQQLTRFYTGLALAILGLPAQAAVEVEEALRLAPASPLTGPAERLRDTIVAARQRERRFSLEVRAGVFYDDNVAVVPDPESGDATVDALRAQDHKSSGELFGLRADYVWLRTESWDATIGYSFFATVNNALPEFDIMDHLVTTGVTHRTAVADMPVQIGAHYAFDALFLDLEDFLFRHSVTLTGVLVESDRHLTQGVARFQDKDFRTPVVVAEENRDARNWMVGGLHLFRFAQDRHFIKIGYQFDYDDADGRNYAYLGHRFLAGGQYTLPWWQIRLKYDLDVHYRDYRHQHTLLPTATPGTKERRDVEIVNVVRGELPLPHGFTLAAEYQSTVADSNLAVFDYTRNVVSLILSWSY